jgi:hypothetical protein
MSHLVISKKNEVYLAHSGRTSRIYYELAGRNFTFDVPNAKFAPAYREQVLGRIHLFAS